MTPAPRKFTVVSTGTEFTDLAVHVLPQATRVARGADRLYFFYQAAGGQDFAFSDLDGQSLIEVHNFETLMEAEAWAAEDARQRQGLLSIEGEAH